MAKKAENIQAVNAWWSVDPEGEKSWHAKFDGTEKEFSRGTIMWVDVYTQKTKQTTTKEVIVVDYIRSDYKSKKPAIFAAYTADLSDEEIEKIKSGKIPQGKSRKRTDGIKQSDIEKILKTLNLICKHLGIDDDGVPF